MLSRGMGIASLLAVMRPSLSTTRHGSKSQGFTLVELMAVVAIISIGAGIAMPAIQRATQQQRANRVVLDIVRMTRRARSEAMAYGRAYLLRHNDQSYGNGAWGRYRLYRGMNNGCRTNDWATITTVDCGAANSYCVDEITMNDPKYRSTTTTVDTLPVFASGFDVCYQPNGTTMMRVGTGTNFAPGLPTALRSSMGTYGGIPVRVRSTENATLTGAARYLLIPPGGVGRVLR